MIRAIWVRSMWIKYDTMVNMNVEVFTYSPTLPHVIFRLEMAQHDNTPEHNPKSGWWFGTFSQLTNIF